MNLHPVYCKIGAQGLAGSLYRVDDVLEGVSYAGKVRADLGLEPVYGFHKEWSDAMVITKELVAAMNKYFDEQEAGK